MWTNSLASPLACRRSSRVSKVPNALNLRLRHFEVIMLVDRTSHGIIGLDARSCDMWRAGRAVLVNSILGEPTSMKYGGTHHKDMFSP